MEAAPQYDARVRTQADLRDDARAAGFDGVEDALKAFLRVDGGRAGNLWASFIASRGHAPAPDTDPSRREAGPVRLCLGGTRPASGWTIVNALPLPGVDVVAEISNLRAWRDGSVDMVYMSHTLEHLDYMDLLQPTLQEVARVIRPGGEFRCSVPDLVILCQMFLATQGDDESGAGQALFRFRSGNPTEEWKSPHFKSPDGISDVMLPKIRMEIVRMIYGGQLDAFDFHKVGFDFCMLRAFLLAAGFSSVQRVAQIDEVVRRASAHWCIPPACCGKRMRARACERGCVPHACMRGHRNVCIKHARARTQYGAALSVLEPPPAPIHVPRARTHTHTHTHGHNAVRLPGHEFLLFLRQPHQPQRHRDQVTGAAPRQSHGQKRRAVGCVPERSRHGNSTEESCSQKRLRTLDCIKRPGSDTKWGDES